MTEFKKSQKTTENAQNIFGQPLTIFGVPVDRETIFTNEKNIYKAAIEKRQRQLIAKITFIKFFLKDGEVIRCLTTGYSPIRWLEQLLTGLAFVYFKRALFIFTERRILHIPTSFNRSAHSSVSQILYEDCTGISLKGRSLIVAYKNGSQETFLYTGRKERKKLKALISGLPIRPKEAGRLQQRVYLCPGCTNVLQKSWRQCRSCLLAFKSKRAALASALLLPGGGYFYSRHPLIGLGLGIIEMLLMGLLVIYFTKFSRLYENLGLPTIAGAIALLIAIKWISSFHTIELIKDFMPASKNLRQRKI
jgi:hypothetical protein